MGAGAAGLVTGRADLAAVGAAAGAVGVVIEQTSSRSSRRRLRQDRSQLRGQIRDLDALVVRLNRELAGQPSVLRPEPPPSPTTGPLPVVSASHRAASPATPRSLPILTANRRGLQSCAPGLPGLPVPAASVFGPGLAALPGQRPPATPITGLHMPPVEDPSLPKLEPGPAAAVLHGGGVPRLEPGPREDLTTRRAGRPGRGAHRADGEPGATGTDDVHDDLALIGAALHAEHAAGAPRPGAIASGGSAPSAQPSARSATVVDLRSVPASAPSTATMGRGGAGGVDQLVYAAIAEAGADDFTLTLERPARRAASLFEPVHRQGPTSAHPPAAEWAPAGTARVDDSEMERLAAAARTASRAMRHRLPPSPYFTPGAFDAESEPARRDSA